MARVFISHAGADLAVAARLREWLVEDGHEVFLDRDLTDGIAAGDDWDDRLHERLRWADALVCVITKSYVDSVWCTAEVAITRSRGGRLVPVRAERGVTHPLLRSVQYADLTRDPEAVRTALTTALIRVGQTHGTGWADDRSPFPGLHAFDADLHRVFFGRDADVGQLADRLRSPAERAGNTLLLVVGPSGCGKSSVLRAGLLPAMAGEPDWWTLPAITPGVDPRAALVRELVAAAKALRIDWDIGDVRTARVVQLVDTILLTAPGAHRKRLLVAVDQFEELLVQTPPDELAAFAELLRALLGGPVSIVATLRPEFLDPLLGHPDLSALDMTPHMLRPMRRETLRTVVEGPARLAGITVSDELVSLLVEDTGSGDALPLLAFALEQLVEGVGRGGELSMARYDTLGGVRGALKRQADEALAAATAASGRGQDAVLTSLLRVVTVDGQDRPTRWHVRRADLSEPEAAELDAFVARRLLTVDTVGGDAVIGASHEAFFTAWPPLDAAIRAAAAALRSRAQVEDAATEWDTNERPAEKLWERGQLAAAMTAMDVTVRGRQVRAGKVYVSPLGRDFLHASVRRDRFRRRRLVVTLSVLLVLAMAAAVVAYVQQRSAREQQRAAQEQALLSTSRRLDDTAESSLDTDPRTALMLSVAAYRLHPDAETYATLQHAVTTTPYAGQLPGVDSGVNSVTFAPDGRRLAVGFHSGAIILWDLRDPLRPRMLGKPFIHFAASVTSVFSPDGNRLFTAGTNGGVAVWDLTDPEHPRTIGTPVAGGDELGGGAWFSPDGTVLATAPADGPGLQLWDLTDPARIRPLGTPLANHAGTIRSVAFSPDGNMMATGSAHTVPVTLWDITQRTAPRLTSTITQDDVIDSLSFSPDGTVLAVGGSMAGTGLWELSDPANPRPARDLIRVSFISKVLFSPRGRTLATTGGADTGLLLWDLSSLNLPQRTERLITGNTDYTAGFSPDGSMLASGSTGGVVTLWNLDRQSHPTLLGPPAVGQTVEYEELYALALTKDARMFATGDRDGTVELWNVADPTRPRRLGEPFAEYKDGTGAVAFSPDGELLVTSGDDRAEFWDVRDPERPRRLREVDDVGGTVRSMLFSADGTSLTMGGDGKFTVWDVRDPERPRRRVTLLEDEQTLGMWRVRDGRVLALVRGSGQHAESSAPVAAPTTEETDTGSGDQASEGSSSGPQEGPGDPNGSRLWDITDPRHPRQLGPGLTGHPDSVETAAMSADGGLLAVSDRSGTVIIWDISDPVRPRRVGDPWSPHGSTAAVLLTFPPQPGIMMTGGIEGTVYLWDVGEPARPRQLGPGLTDNLDAPGYLVFSTDGMTMASAGSEADVVMWDLKPLYDLRRDPVAVACQITDRGLDRDEWVRRVSGMPYQDTCA